MAFLEKYYPEISYNRNLLEERLKHLELRFHQQHQNLHKAHHHQLEANIVNLYDLVRKTAQNQSSMQQQIHMLRNKSVGNLSHQQLEHKHRVHNLEHAYRRAEQKAYSLRQRIKHYYPTYAKRQYYSRYNREPLENIHVNNQIYAQKTRLEEECRKMYEQTVHTLVQTQEQRELQQLNRERETINNILINNSQGLSRLQNSGMIYCKDKSGNGLKDELMRIQRQILEREILQNSRLLQPNSPITHLKNYEKLLQDSPSRRDKQYQLLCSKEQSPNRTRFQQNSSQIIRESVFKSQISKEQIKEKLHDSPLRRHELQKEDEVQQSRIARSKFYHLVQQGSSAHNSPDKKGVSEIRTSQQSMKNSGNQTEIINNNTTDSILIEQNDAQSVSASSLKKCKSREYMRTKPGNSDLSNSLSQSKFKSSAGKLRKFPEQESELESETSNSSYGQIQLSKPINSKSSSSNRAQKLSKICCQTGYRASSPKALSASKKRSQMRSSDKIFKNVMNRIQKRIANVYAVYEDATFRNTKHEQDHLLNTYSLESRLRDQMIQKIEKHSLVERRYGLCP